MKHIFYTIALFAASLTAMRAQTIVEADLPILATSLLSTLTLLTFGITTSEIVARIKRGTSLSSQLTIRVASIV